MLGLIRAPDLDRPGLTWFNVERPLSLRDLAGRMVILDFWTYCCVNCLHVLPTLRRIEQAFPREVVVVGVHSPKFTAEREAANVSRAVARNGIRHPVVHDPGLELWDAYAVQAWPTLVFICPEGRIIGTLGGEPATEILLAGLGELVRGFAGTGALRPGAPFLGPEAAFAGRLRFPAKIKALPGGDGRKRWALADTGNHQVVVLDDGGAEEARFGSGRAGLFDAGPGTSAFNAPQGLACGLGCIYVADTGNHAIRRIGLDDGRVETIAGVGARGAALSSAAAATETALASVWDLALAGDRLYFANAGTHQVGRLDLARGVVGALAGSSAEGIADGPALSAQMAQPSGLALDPEARTLYVADSESSAVRAVDLVAERVETLVGAGLFEFGDVDGPFETARLQHPLGIAWCDGDLIVADSYNDRLRLLDLRRREVRGLGMARPSCGDAACGRGGEPAGVAADGRDRLLVVATNDHRVAEVRPGAHVHRTWAA